MARRTNALALASRLVSWLARTRRAEVDELVPGVIARAARLGGYLVVLEVGYRAHGVLIVASAATGAIAFLAEWTPEEGTSLTATPEALAAIASDLDGVTAMSMVVH